MIQLTYSNRLEALFERLAGDLDAHYGSGGTSRLEPALLVVPSRSVDLWVRRALARRDGIAANLTSLFLRGFVDDLFRRNAPGLRVVDSGRAFDAVLSLLLDDQALAEPALAPVRAYLKGGGDSRDTADVRRVQLATQLSRVFEEYAYSRPEMLRQWARGKTVLRGVALETESWQSQVWRAALGKGGRVEAAPQERLIRLHEVPEHLASRPIAKPAPVFLFGLSYVASLYQHVLSNVARHAELHVYTLNPCLEFWEDLASVKDLGRGERLARRSERKGMEAVLASEDPFGLTERGDPPPLVLWGRPGRENIRLLNELSECDFQGAFQDPLTDGPTLLRQLQRDILAREPERLSPDPAFQFGEDKSLQFLACPNAQREAEAIASEIVSLVRADEARPGPSPRLRFSEIAVLVAGADAGLYFSHFKSAFSQRGFEIPCTVDEASSGAPSQMAEAADLLLSLPLGGFTRSEVLRVVTHPAVAGRYPDVNPSEWVARCDALGIFRGISREDLAGTYLERDLHNWDQGLRRLALGGAMTGGKSGDGREFTLEGERYLVEEHAEEVQGSSARFGVLVRSLLNDARYAKGAELRAAEWSEFLAAVLETYLAPRDDDGMRDRERCLQAVRGLAKLKLGGLKVSYRIASELARGALVELSSRRSGQVGVTVSTLQPMRGLPFKVLFIAGLGEGRFPAPAPRDTLDLRLAQPRPGDVNAREQDQYMFLEALLSAREKLYLSYVARNELTGEPLEASSIITELQRMLRLGYLPREQAASAGLVREVRLRRFDEELFPGLYGKPSSAPPAPPEARLEGQMLALRRHLEGQGVTRLDPHTVKNILPATLWKELEERLGVLRPPEAGALFRHDAPVRVTLATLRKFLECPLQGAARALLRLEEDEDDLSVIDDEPFDAGPLQESALQRGTFERLVRSRGNRPDPGAVLDEVAKAQISSGHLPAGVFSGLAREGHLEVVAQWEELLAKHLQDAGITEPRPEVVRIGGASDEHEEVDQAFDPILLELDGALLGATGPVRVELVGRTGLLLKERTHSIRVRRRSAKKLTWMESAYCAQESLSGFLDHVALCALGQEAERQAVVLLADRKGKSATHVTRFRTISQERARAFLASLVSDLLGRVHDYLLPAPAVFHFHQDEANLAAPPPLEQEKAGTTFAEVVEEFLDAKACDSLYGPIHNPADFVAPRDEEARELIARRYGLYFEHRVAREEPIRAPKKVKATPAASHEPVAAKKPRRKSKSIPEGDPA